MQVGRAYDLASRSQGQDGRGSACRRGPLRGVGANPSQHIDHANAIMTEVAVMDRLVMRNTIPQEVNTLNTIVDVGTDLARITRCRMVRKGGYEHRNP